jgi:phosphatidylserine/phosphatidylglycerophosphate/cardiolipin synthase-like enzyme
MHAELLHAVREEAAPPAERPRVRWLVDNAAAYDALLRSIAGARRSIWISQLAFDADCVAYDSGDDQMPGRLLIDELTAASRERNVDVRILLNASLLLDTAAPLRAFLARAGATHVQVRGVRHFPQLLHAKMVVVDGIEAFLLGSPLANGYWDDPRHRPTDARRPERELGGRPVHDLSLSVTGSAAVTIACFFAELWNDASVAPGRHQQVIVPASPPRASAAPGLRIVRTVPARGLTSHPAGLTEILSAIEAGLRSAQSLVYIEHQYLSARPVVAALVAALARSPALRVIVVLNQNPDVTAYRGWQNRRLLEAGLLDHPRVGVFTLWSAEARADGAGWDVNQLFVHSKVLIVDDRWATVGSANLDGVSLHSYGDDFVGRPGRRVFRNVRNYDVNLVLDEARGKPDGAVRALRERLWHEHLGEPAELSAPRGPGDPLERWRSRAAGNIAALNDDGTGAGYRGFVLPYSRRATPKSQLADIGVRVDQARTRLHFDPSWLEVHCSPNWLRNMFL